MKTQSSVNLTQVRAGSDENTRGSVKCFRAEIGCLTTSPPCVPRDGCWSLVDGSTILSRDTPLFSVSFRFSSASPVATSVFAEVEARKCYFLAAASEAAACGACFRRLVLEASGGGWTPTAVSGAWIASDSRSLSCGAPVDVGLKIAQRISCTFTGETREPFRG